jgi:ribosomal protein L7/L12
MATETIDEAFESELRALVAAGLRGEAVRRFRERTGQSLRQAQDLVEALSLQKGITQRQTDSLEWDVITLLERGQKSQAVAFYRERTGSGIKESRDAVERISTEHNLIPTGRSGCLGVLLLGIAVLLAAFAVP